MSHVIHVGYVAATYHRRARLALALLLLAGTAGLGPPSEAQGANQGFVQAAAVIDPVTGDVTGGQFVLNGEPFRFVGTNAYYLYTTAARGSLAETTGTMQMANELGLKVLRIWGFADGTNYGPALQPAAGVYDETSFRALDWVLHTADQAGVRLIVVLVNRWGDFGGMPQYASWCAPKGPGVSEDAFYTEPACKDLYRRYVEHVLNRVNTVNGRAYRNDPTIFAWELANEPNMRDGADSSGQIVLDWVTEMAGYVKSIDPNHMVGTGEEGYDTSASGYSDPIAAYGNQQYLFNGWKGVSFTQNTAVAHIDFGSIHFYPEYWNLPASAGPTWIADHARIARSLGKPLLFGEFGYSTNAGPIFDSWLGTWQTEQGGGALVWQLMCASCYGWRDQFGILHEPGTGATDVLARYATQANGGEAPPPPPPPPTPAEPTFTLGTTAAAPNPVRRSQMVGIETAVTSDVAADGIVVDLEVYDSADTRVAQKAYSGQSFTPEQAIAYHWDWRATVPAGTYTVKVGIFSAGWVKLYIWNNEAATVTVVRR